MRPQFSAIALTLALSAPAAAQHMHGEHHHHHESGAAAGQQMHIHHGHDAATFNYPNYAGYSSPGAYYSSAAGCNNSGSAYNGLVALGQYNYLTAMAALNMQAARAKAIENDEQAVRAFYAKREQHNDFHVRARRPRATADELTAQSKAAAPKRLTALEFDPISGNINWPTALLRPEFDADRTEFERLLDQRRMSIDESSAPSGKEVARLTCKLQASLKSAIDELTPSEYVGGKRFLASLQQEIKSPFSAQGIAAR